MGTIQAVIYGKFDNIIQTRNVMYFAGADSVPANYQDLADGIYDCFDETLTLLVDNYSFYGVRFRDMDNPGVPGVWKEFTSGPLVGTTTGDYLPTQTALLVSFSAQATRPNRKRLYLAGFAEGSYSDGAYAATVVAHGEAIADNLLDFATVSSMEADFVTFWLINPSTGEYGVNILDTRLVSAVPATQRRRRLGVGI